MQVWMFSGCYNKLQRVFDQMLETRVRKVATPYMDFQALEEGVEGLAKMRPVLIK